MADGIEMADVSAEKTPDPRIVALIAALEKGMSLNEASRVSGISARHVRRLRAEDSGLDLAIREAMIDADDAVEAVTFRNCLDPDPSHNVLRMFWLKSRRSEVYKDKVGVEASGEITFRYVNDWRSDGP